MKKLSLGKLKLLSEEVLERSQVVTIYGGSGYGGSGGSGTCRMTCNSGCFGYVSDCGRDTADFFCSDDGGPAYCTCN